MKKRDYLIYGLWMTGFKMNKTRTLADFSDGRKNNFDLIRFFCASLVIFSHSYPLSGSLSDPLVRLSQGFADLGSIAVRVFFTISGFLITESFLRRSDLIGFLEARFLRIFPGLIAAILFSVLLSSVFSTLSFGGFFHQHEVYSFFLHNVSLLQIESNPIKAVNASIWTLPTEVQLYLLVALTGFMGILSNKPVANLSLLTLAWVTFQSPNGASQSGPFQEILIWSFALGALFYINRESVRLSIIGACAFSLGVFLLKKQWFFGIGLQVALAYWTFIIAYHPRIRFHNFAKFGDFSYGLYVYAFPIEQALNVSEPRSQIRTFLIAYPLSLLMAFISWHLIEKNALKLKRKLSGMPLDLLYGNWSWKREIVDEMDKILK
jgi:peptidoglycan/LPS O-acetylase OafA/YrhL